MKIFSKFMIILLVLYIVNVTVSVFTEIEALEDKRDNLGMMVRLAYKSAVLGQQTLDEDGLNALGAVDSEYVEGYSEYLDEIESQAVSAGMEEDETDLYRIIDFLRRSINDYNATGSALYTPIQFSMTFVDEETFKEDFKDYLMKMIEDNYGAPTESGETENVFRARDSLIIDDIRIEIGDPELRYLNTTDNAYAKVFGSNRNEAMNIAFGENSDDSMFNYVVVYDVDIEVDWSSVTATPYFNFGEDKSRPFFKLRLPDVYLASNGQLKIPGPTRTFSIEYVLTN